MATKAKAESGSKVQEILEQIKEIMLSSVRRIP